MTRRALALTLVVGCMASVAAVAPAAAQDINPRKGFSVKITEPKTRDVVVGEVTIRAQVTAKREQDIARVEFYIDDKLILADSEPPFQVVYNFGKRTGAHVIRAVAYHRDGPTASDFVITRSFDFQYVVNVQRVVLDVSVRDDKHRFVQNLTAADFSVTEDGRPQQISAVSPERRPLLVGVIIDTSGSMRDRIKEAQDAACGFTATLEPQDRGFAIDFDEQVTLLEETTGDRDKLCRAVRTTRAVGGTALYDAMHAAFRVIHDVPSERRAIVLLTDGEDNESRITFDQLMQEVQLNDVTIYTIGLDVGALSTARSVLNKMADETGGRAYFVKRASELKDTYQQIANELRTLYQLVYSSQNQKFDGRFLKIDVKVKKGAGYEVRHRSGYNAVEP